LSWVKQPWLKETEPLSILFKTYITDKKHANNDNEEDYLFNVPKDVFTSKGGHLIPVLPDFLMAITSLPERAEWIKGLIVLHPGSETLQCLEEMIVLALKETGRLTKGFGKLPRDEFSSFRYWFAVPEIRDMEALLEMDKDEQHNLLSAEYEEGKEKWSTAAAASDPDVIYVEAAATNDPEILVFYAKHWSSEDHDDKNGKQTKLEEFPDENETTKYRQDLRRTENFNKGNQEEVDNLT
jgi:hypothetical protein